MQHLSQAHIGWNRNGTPDEGPGTLEHCSPDVIADVSDEVYGTSESGVNDERNDEKGRRYRMVVVVTL